MFSRALILFLLISNLPLIADGGFWGWTTFNPIAELGKRVADLGKKVANTVKEGFDKVVSEIGNGFSIDTLRGLTPLSNIAEPVEGVIVFVGEKITGNDKDWACGPDDPKWLDKPSHIGTELLASMIRACRLRREAINQCCVAHDKCCKTKPRKDPCDEPFCKCLEKVGKDSGDVNCLNVLTLFCLTMNVAGDKDGPYHKWIKEQAIKATPASSVDKATPASSSNKTTPASSTVTCLVSYQDTKDVVVACPDDKHSCFYIKCEKRRESETTRPLFDGFERKGCVGGKDKMSQCQKLRLAYMPYGYCSCFIGAKDVSMSNANIPADDKLIHLPALNKKSADVAERDSQSKFDKQ